jgi:hypothetical protein
LRARISDAHTGLRQPIGGAHFRPPRLGQIRLTCAHLPALRRPRQYVLNSAAVFTCRRQKRMFGRVEVPESVVSDQLPPRSESAAGVVVGRVCE